MFSYELRIEDSDARARLSELVGRMRNPQGFYRNVGEYLLNRTHENFENEQDPDGAPWPRLSPVTVGQRLSRNGNAPLTILRVSGRLAGSYNYVASENDVRIGSPVVYAHVHHAGGKAGRGRKVTIPARPAVGIGARDEAEILAIAEDWLAVE